MLFKTYEFYMNLPNFQHFVSYF